MNLSRRQREVVQLVCAGHSNDEIGRLLHISPQTVKNHLRSIYLSTGAVSRVDVVILALADGLADLDECLTVVRGRCVPALSYEF